MTELDRATLLARCQTLEQHTRALHQAFRDPAFKQDAEVVLRAVEAARVTLGGDPSPADLRAVQQALEGANLLLASLGRTT